MGGFNISFEDIAVRLIIATVLSSLIGVERQVHGKSAGLRTNALVGLGSAAMTLSGILMADSAVGSSVVDPTRMASIIIQGIGFIGAGTIIQASGAIRGLTTAATLWVVAGIGIACGFGLWEIALIVTALVLILLVIFRYIDTEAEKLESNFSDQFHHGLYRLHKNGNACLKEQEKCDPCAARGSKKKKKISR
jgi:putative Mg2+ transporter-C (MgtC) family protein